ncbi:hypothetical protein, partial [Streptomyces thermolilacinus]|uniref:hypothetical protein n=1 Tax=Streptomyces thermolilacinus TaxID=285540 RepID=UPI0033E40BFA
MTTPVPPRVALVNGSFEEPSVTGVESLPDASPSQAPRRSPADRAPRASWTAPTGPGPTGA